MEEQPRFMIKITLHSRLLKTPSAQIDSSRFSQIQEAKTNYNPQSSVHITRLCYSCILPFKMSQQDSRVALFRGDYIKPIHYVSLTQTAGNFLIGNEN